MSDHIHNNDVREGGISRRTMVAALAGSAVAAGLARAGLSSTAKASDVSWLIGDVERNADAVRDTLPLLRDDLKALDFAKIAQDSAALSSASHVLDESMMRIL